MTHTAMKMLLEFEDITYYVQYNARNEFFSLNTFRPSPDCNDKNCMKVQAEKKGKPTYHEIR